MSRKKDNLDAGIIDLDANDQNAVIILKITYDSSSVATYGYIWKNGSCVHKYLEPANYDEITL